MRQRFAIALGVAVAGVLALGAQSAAAAIGVTNTNDSGAGSLRAAVNQANHLVGPDRIAISATGTLALDNPLPNVDTDLAIAGPGVDQLTIHGAPGFGSVFTIQPSRAVTLDRISIVGGSTGIGNAGALTLSRSAVRDARGGGIFNAGDATVTHSVVADNRRAGIETHGTLTVQHSLVARNRMSGIHNYGTATVDESAMSGNFAESQGGGILNEGHLTVSRSTLTGNSSNSYGGAISSNAHLTVRRSTLSGNSAGVTGGGIMNANSDVTVSQSTVIGAEGGAISTAFASGTPTTLKSTIVAGGCDGAPRSKGYNLSDDASCNLTAPGDQPNTEPLLRPLANYGGPTKTLALDPSSPAVDAGLAGDGTTDQRGFPRIVNYPGVFNPNGAGDADIGAFELQAP